MNGLSSPGVAESATLELIEQLTSALPDAALATAIILVGWLVALLASAIVRRLLGRIERTLPGASAPAVAGTQARRTVDMLATAVRWFVFLLFLIVATEAVGLATVTSWLGGVATYVPRVFAAIAIAFGATVAGRMAKAAVVRAGRSADIPQADRIGHVVQAAVVIALALVAVDQLGIEIAFIVGVLEITLAMALGGAALAFGLGARTTVENILAVHYLRKSYDLGQLVRVGDVQGRVVRLDATSVVLANDEGEITIPARDFALQSSVKLHDGGA